jgi:hypothetical protein
MRALVALAAAAALAADVVCGFAGSDRIDVRGGGTDTVFCGPGRDTMLADAGDRIAHDCERVVG